MAKALALEKEYQLERGWYYEPMWSIEYQHWWCADVRVSTHQISFLMLTHNLTEREMTDHEEITEWHINTG